jgi:hypothetical protein
LIHYCFIKEKITCTSNSGHQISQHDLVSCQIKKHDLVLRLSNQCSSRRRAKGIKMTRRPSPSFPSLSDHNTSSAALHSSSSPQNSSRNARSWPNRGRHPQLRSIQHAVLAHPAARSPPRWPPHVPGGHRRTRQPTKISVVCSPRSSPPSACHPARSR